MDFRKLEWLIDTMPARGIPLCDLAVTWKGETVFRRSSGFSDAEKKTPVSSQDLYWIFSATKVITSIAVMRLVEQGKISLHDPVSKYLPAYGKMNRIAADGAVVPCETPMLVEHLLSMSGGMDYEVNCPSLIAARQDPLASTQDLVNAMAEMPLLFEPGTRYKYSFCYDVLAAVVEVVSGMRFSEYLRRFIFEPLGMENTGFHPTARQEKRISALYTYIKGTSNAELIPTNNPYMLSQNYESGGAGLFSCVDDYIRFVTALACDGKSKDGYVQLKPETIALLETNRLCEAGLHDFVNQRFFGYGWGLCGRVHMDPLVSLSLSPVGEFGWDGAACSFAMVDRKNQLALFLGTHVRSCTYGYNVLHPLIRNLVYEGLDLGGHERDTMPRL